MKINLANAVVYFHSKSSCYRRSDSILMRFSPERHCLLPKSYSLQIPDCMSHLNSNVWGSKKNAKNITKNMNPNLNRNALNMIDPLIEV